MAEPRRSRDVFPFFELPLEMRDMIYADSLQDVRGNLKCGGLKYKFSNMPRANLLLVSKQFGQEYKARARKTKKTLLLEDTHDTGNSHALKLPGPTAAYTTITLNISIHPHGPDQDLYYYMGWLLALTSLLPSCTSCTAFRLNIKMSHLDLANLQEMVGKLISKASRLCPVSFDAQVSGASRGHYADFRSGLEKDSVPMMKWSREKQALEPIPR
ncbi:hypothetical protein M409DRAFT_58665 [Zasmidium cellare ATCC 36951]|uniref:F-box domain-containing protein n=1 Tax=Zasmidium cellare ATCC 36951 TaxID=1080233 RepID=A0A6A6C440_ZASCE|nr:uncharacterized protein M409DRAFT_58665 [Zasmidium cellare ATCC 36951]KAF2161884.1 hypothetical protein M409DRAFT_58665 [Zasmidium cellare ATCC 36951]